MLLTHVGSIPTLPTGTHTHADSDMTGSSIAVAQQVVA